MLISEHPRIQVSKVTKVFSDDMFAMVHDDVMYGVLCIDTRYKNAECHQSNTKIHLASIAFTLQLAPSPGHVERCSTDTIGSGNEERFRRRGSC